MLLEYKRLIGLVVVVLVMKWLLREAFAPSTKTLRVVQFNVNRLSDFEAVASTLEALRPTIITLNEVDVARVPGCVDELAKRLGLSGHFYGHARNGTYGNAVLSPSGTVVLEHQLTGGAVVSLDDKREHRIVRGLLLVQCDDIAVGVTHLDHIAEVERAIQAQSIVDAIDGLDTKDLLLLGDLNALRRSDYPEAAWSRLEQRNRNKGWAPPADSAGSGGALDVLHQSGFRDLALDQYPAVMTSVSHCLHDDCTLHEDSCFTKTPVKTPPNPPACQRIDYAFSSPSLAKRITDCRVSVDAHSNGSDHYPLVVDLTLGAAKPVGGLQNRWSSPSSSL